MALSKRFDCPTNAVPADLPIKAYNVYAIIPGQNVSNPAMVECCRPNKPQLVRDCWLWCEIPEPLRGDKKNPTETGFGTCLRLNGRNYTESNGLLTLNPSSGSATRAKPIATSFWAVVVLIILGLTEVLGS